MKKYIKVTIDGPSATGKSTTAKLLAKKLGFTHLDSGAIYRAIAYFFKKKYILEESDEAQKKALNDFTYFFTGCYENKRHFVNEIDVTDEIRSREISDISSKVSVKGFVRDFATNLQRTLAEEENIVVEGRDTGSVVFPDADIKFYLDADPAERGKRRFLELKANLGTTQFSKEEIIKDIEERDQRDKNRDLSPLICPEGAIVVDTTHLSVKAQVRNLQNHVKKLSAKHGWKKPYFVTYNGKKCALLYRITKWVFTAYFRLFHKYKVFGLEHFKREMPAIIACNHVSLLDPPMLGCACPQVIHCLAKKALFKHKFMRYWLSKTNTYPVTGSSDDKEVMKKVVTLLLKGDKVLIFPEGTRSKDGSVQPLRKGLALFADKGRAAVIPTAVVGPETAMPVGKSYPKFFTKLIVAFGPPVYFSKIIEEVGDKKKAREVFLVKVQEEIQALIDQYKPMLKEKK